MDVLTGLADRAPEDGRDQDRASAAPVAPRRVLAGGLLDRLAQINRARRALRDLNLRVARVCWCDGNPYIEIERETGVSLAPLLDRMGRRAFRCVSGRTRISGEFHGVTVCWYEWADEDFGGGECPLPDRASKTEGPAR